MRSLIPAVICSCVVLIAVALPSASAQLAGGWSKVSVKDDGVLQAAKFAVEAQHDTIKADGKNEKLSLVKVLAARQQVVQGMNYNLTLQVKAGGALKKAEAEVWARVWLKGADQYKLTSWKIIGDNGVKPAN